MKIIHVKDPSHSIYDINGYKYRVPYPTDVYQLLSPNNNKLKGCKWSYDEECFKFDKVGFSSIHYQYC